MESISASRVVGVKPLNLPELAMSVRNNELVVYFGRFVSKSGCYLYLFV